MPIDSLRIELQTAMQVKGKVDLSAFAQNKATWGWLGFYRLPKDAASSGIGEFADSAGIDFGDGSFSTEDLAPGQYRMRLHVHYDGERQDEQYECTDVVVPRTGLADLQVRPGRLVAD
jgi:hypothetical protein